MHLIALVGADGMGKTTQARRLTDRLVAHGYRATCVRPVFLLFDPWRLRDRGASVPRLSPRIARMEKNGGRAGPFTSVLGYAYAMLTYAYMRTFLRRHEFIVCDRYFYQYFYDLAGRAARNLARSFPKPDLVLWLDGAMDVLLGRIDTTPKDAAEAAYFEDVLEFYRGLAPDLGFVRIDAGTDESSVGDQIWDALIREVGPRAG